RPGRAGEPFGARAGRACRRARDSARVGGRVSQRKRNRQQREPRRRPATEGEVDAVEKRGRGKTPVKRRLAEDDHVARRDARQAVRDAREPDGQETADENWPEGVPEFRRRERVAETANEREEHVRQKQRGAGEPRP